MSILVLLEVKAQPGKVDEFKSDLEEALPDTRAFDGCEGVTAHENQDDPGQITLIERWGSKSAYEAYTAWREERGDLARLAGLVSGPPSIRYFDDVPV